MFKYLIILFVISSSVVATVVEMPRIEALVYAANARPISPTKNYDFEIDFFGPFSQVFVRISLKEGGIENFTERDALAMKIVSNINYVNKTYNVPNLTVKVDYHDKD